MDTTAPIIQALFPGMVLRPDQATPETEQNGTETPFGVFGAALASTITPPSPLVVPALVPATSQTLTSPATGPAINASTGDVDFSVPGQAGALATTPTPGTFASVAAFNRFSPAPQTATATDPQFSAPAPAPAPAPALASTPTSTSTSTSTPALALAVAGSPTPGGQTENLNSPIIASAAPTSGDVSKPGAQPEPGSRPAGVQNPLLSRQIGSAPALQPGAPASTAALDTAEISQHLPLATRFSQASATTMPAPPASGLSSTATLDTAEISPRLPLAIRFNQPGAETAATNPNMPLSALAQTIAPQSQTVAGATAPIILQVAAGVTPRADSALKEPGTGKIGAAVIVAGPQTVTATIGKAGLLSTETLDFVLRGPVPGTQSSTQSSQGQIPTTATTATTPGTSATPAAIGAVPPGGNGALFTAGIMTQFDVPDQTTSQPSGAGPINTEFQLAMTATRGPAMPASLVADQRPALLVATNIRQAIEQGVNRFSIRMDPPELGRVDVQLTISADGRVTASLTAERQDTLDLLQRDARLLERNFQDAGLKADSGSLNFSLRDQSSEQDSFAHRTNEAEPETAFTETEEETPGLAELALRRPAGDGALDLLV